MEQYQKRVIILFFLLAAILSVILSLSGDHWIKAGACYSGLWRKCRSEGGTVKCDDLPHDSTLPGFFHYVRTFFFIGLGFYCIGIIYFVAMVARPRSFGPACLAVFAVVSGLSLLVGLSIYTYFNNDEFTDSVRYHWSYFVGWASVLFAIIASALSCHEARRPSSPYAQAYRLE